MLSTVEDRVRAPQDFEAKHVTEHSASLGDLHRQA